MASQENIAGATSGDYIKLDNVILDVYSQEILFKAQPTMRFESVAVKRTELGTMPGNKIKFLRYNSLGGSSQLVETVPIVTDVLSSSTIEITVSEQGKAVSMSEFLMRSAITDVLSDAATLLGMHYAKNRDALIRDALAAGTNVLYAGDKASRAELDVDDTFDVDLIRSIVETMATAKAPKFNGDSYIGFIHPHNARYLRRDGAWVNVNMYADPTNILNGEIGRFEDVRFIETTMVQYIKKGTQDIWADNEDTGVNTVIAANAATDVYRTIFVGDNAVGLAESLPVEMRDNGVEDFGRKHSLAYYGIWGAGLIESGHSLIAETA